MSYRVFLFSLISFGVLLIISLGYFTFNLAVENDGLRQVISEDKRSIATLLDYVSGLTNCEVTPSQLEKIVSGSLYVEPGGGNSTVAHSAFFARFHNHRLVEVEISNVKKIAVCGVQ